MTEKVDVRWHEHAISRESRESMNGHRGAVLWFTGLSGCGKSTVANLVDQKLHALSVRSFVLDGDNIRHGLKPGSPPMLADRGEQYAQRFGLGFSAEDRQENIRRIGTVAQLFCDAGMVTLAAFVSPYIRDRDEVRQYVESHGRKGDFVEVFVDAPLEVCEARDPKGLYKMARAGEIKNFTGIDDPYEPPADPEIRLQAGDQQPDILAAEVITYLQSSGYIAK